MVLGNRNLIYFAMDALRFIYLLNAIAENKEYQQHDLREVLSFKQIISSLEVLI